MIDKSDNAGGKSKRKAPTKKPAKSAAAQGKPKAGTAPNAANKAAKAKTFFMCRISQKNINAREK